MNSPSAHGLSRTRVTRDTDTYVPLVAHRPRSRDTDVALPLFLPDAVVVDQAEAFRGTDETLGFLRTAGAEFSYTTELIGVQRIDDSHWVATNRLVGNFRA